MVIVESDAIPSRESALVCPITSTLHEDGPLRRQTAEPTPATGVRAASQIMVTSKLAALIGVKG